MKRKAATDFQCIIKLYAMFIMILLDNRTNRLIQPSTKMQCTEKKIPSTYVLFGVSVHNNGSNSSANNII